MHFFSAVQTADGRDLAYELDLKSWLFTAWGSLYKKFCQQTSDCKNAVIRERGKLNRMTEYLMKHCNEKLTLSGIADACQVSSGDFCRFFKKHMGMTPFEYLQKCRIWNSMDAVLEKQHPCQRLQQQTASQEQAIFPKPSARRWAALRRNTANGTRG